MSAGEYVLLHVPDGDANWIVRNDGKLALVWETGDESCVAWTGTPLDEFRRHVCKSSKTS